MKYWVAHSVSVTRKLGIHVWPPFAEAAYRYATRPVRVSYQDTWTIPLASTPIPGMNWRPVRTSLGETGVDQVTPLSVERENRTSHVPIPSSVDHTTYTLPPVQSAAIAGSGPARWSPALVNGAAPANRGADHVVPRSNEERT